MSSRMLKKKLQAEGSELPEDPDTVLSDDIDTELSSAAIPIGGGGAKKKQLNINRYDLVRKQNPLNFPFPFNFPQLLPSCCPSHCPRAR